MNLEQIKQALLTAKERFPHLGTLVDAFDRFIELYAARNQKHRNVKKFQKNLDDTYALLRDEFDKALASKGMNFGMMLQYVTTPSNFTPESWQELEEMKEDLDRLEAPLPKRQKKLSKNVRI